MSVSRCLGPALSALGRMHRSQWKSYIDALPEACPHDDCTTGTSCRVYVDSVAGPMCEQKRRECEARDWLRHGYTDRARVHQLMKLIASKRGHEAAEDLRREMREQWGRRSEWLGVAE